MEPKEVLIRILSKFDDAGTKAAQQAINQLKQASSQVASKASVTGEVSSGQMRAVKLAQMRIKAGADLEKSLLREVNAEQKAASAAQKAEERKMQLRNKAAIALEKALIKEVNAANKAAANYEKARLKEAAAAQKAATDAQKAEERKMQLRNKAAIALEKALIKEVNAVNKAAIQKQAAELKGIRDSIKARNSLVGLSAKLDNALNKESNSARKAASSHSLLASATKSVSNSFKSMAGGILSAINPLNFFRTGFGRVTMGLATWEAWRQVKYGFLAMADAAVTANAKMQTAMGSFTVMSGGNKQIAQQYIDILKTMSVETGVAYDKLLEGAKSLPTKVGQNFKAFEEIVTTAIALGFFDPERGVEGAFYSLRNALEGGAQGLRSLIQSFEIGTVPEFNKALDETGDVLSALQLMLKRTNFDAKQFLEGQKDTYPVVLESLKSIVRELIRISTADVFQLITNRLVDMRNWLQENQAKLEAVAKVISEKLVTAYQMLLGFIKAVILGGKELTAANVFQGIIDGVNVVLSKIEVLARGIISVLNFLANAFNKIFGGGESGAEGAGQAVNIAAKKIEDTGNQAAVAIDKTTDKVKSSGKAMKDAVEKVVDDVSNIPVQATGGIISALTSITEGGRETIKRFVEGMTKGLGGDALAKVRDAVLDNVINLEGQELAQEKSIRKLEDWVDEAAKEVERAKDKLQIFDLQTADIPERYTRARRRQLETEVMAAEREEKRRKEALDFAKEQLAVTKDILAAQRDVLSNIEDAVKAAEEGSDTGIYTGFVAPTKDLEGYKNKVEELTGVFRDKLQPVFTRLREDLEKLSEILRGLFGAETTGKFNEMYETGVKFSDTISAIYNGISDIITKIDELFAAIIPGWENIDPGVRKFLLAVVGVVTLKAVILPIAFELVKFTAGQALGAVGSALISALTTAGGAIGASGAAVFLVTVGILIATVTWGENEKELGKWFSGQRIKELTISLKFIGTEILNKVLQLLGMEPVSISVEGKTVTPGVDQASQIENIWQSTWNKLKNMWDEGDMRKAAEYGFTPIIDEAEKVENELVGNSIFPDMMDAIYGLFGNLPNRLTGPLGTLGATISESMSGIKMQWIADWNEMVQAAVIAMEQINVAQSNMQTSAAAASTGSGNQASTRQLTPYESLRINLNAAETRRLMQEGVAEGMSDVARGLRGTSGYSGR